MVCGMTALPDWLMLSPEGVTADEYERLPEDICKRIEIVDGAVIVNASPRRPHQRIARKLANVLEAAVGESYSVDMDVDLRLRDVPLLNRRPDVVVYDVTLDGSEVLRPEHCALVVEVMSPGSITADQQDKPAEYAAAGIAHFWRLENDDDTATGLRLYRYQLDRRTGTYAELGVHSGAVDVAEPLALQLDFAELV